MTVDFDQIIASLNAKIEEFPNHCFFNKATSVEKIGAFEKEFNISLPKSYKKFLLHFNGGFISDREIEKGRDLETQAWNSNYIFGIEELKDEYIGLKNRNWKLYNSHYKSYPFIPFCHTRIGEILIFVNPLDQQAESPIFDAFHEEFPNSWGILYKIFGEFLEDYIERNGSIATTSYDSPTVSEYLDSMGKRDARLR